MSLEIDVLATAEEVAEHAAAWVAALAREAVADHGRFTFAVSGGRTPWVMFAYLADEDVPWAHVALYQVDERVAPDGDPDRNLTNLWESLPNADAEVHAMPVRASDLEAAAAEYAPGGHTASLVPGDPVLAVTDRAVGLTQPYQGHRRMSLTYPTLNRSREVIWIVTGESKVDALHRLRAGDRNIPAAGINVDRQFVIADGAAAPDGPPSARPSS